MSKKFQAVMNREARGYILRVLKINYPHGVRLHTIDICLIDAGILVSPGELSGFVDYLAERGYITRTTKGVMESGMEETLTLAAKGVDLLEGTIEDPGVNAS